MKNKSWFGRLAALVAVLALAVAAGFPTAAMATTGSDALAAGTGSANAWQVVSGEYRGNDVDNKKVLGENVRAQKNIVPTGTENEFLIYESIDLRQMWRQEYKQIFEHATYRATTSHNYKEEDIGRVVNKMTGNQSVNVSTTDSSYPNSALVDIKDWEGNLLASGVTLYWDQAQNTTVYLQVGNKYIIIAAGLKEGTGQHVIVQLSKDATQLVEEQLTSSTTTNLVNLTNVTDEMGPNITYVETVSCDGSTSFDNGTLTWTPTLKSNPTVVSEDGEPQEELVDNEDGTKTRTRYGYQWATNVAELVYRVWLKPSDSTGIVPGDAAHTATNGPATVHWEGGRGKLDTPVVRGMHYELKLKKVSTIANNKPLKGATFQLFYDEACTDLVYSGDWNGGAHTPAIAVSDENGLLVFKGLQHSGGYYTFDENHAPTWHGTGQYYLKEIQAPTGYEPETDELVKGSYVLSYTVAPGNLEADGSEALLNLYNKSDKWIKNKPRRYKVIVKKVDAEDETKVLEGAKFDLSGELDEASKENKTESKTTDSDGLAKFDAILQPGDYTLKETEAPKGYILDNTLRDLKITEDEKGTPGVTVGGKNAKVEISALDKTSNKDYAFYTVTVTVSDRFSVPLRVKKYAADANGKADLTKPLKGAKFTLYTDEACTKPATLYSDAGLSNQVTELPTDDKGVLTWYGLSADTYWLNETYAPAGYKLFERVIKITVADNGTATAAYDANGDGQIGDGETQTLNKEKLNPEGAEDAKVSYITIADPANPDMPTTGSSGRLVLTILGVGLIAGGAALVAWLRRRGGSVAAR